MGGVFRDDQRGGLDGDYKSATKLVYRRRLYIETSKKKKRRREKRKEKQQDDG